VSEALVTVRDLCVPDRSGRPLLSNVSFQVASGEAVGVLGRAGSGKTVLARSLLGLFPSDDPGPTGELRFDGVEQLGAAGTDPSGLRGRDIALIPSGGRGLLNPVVRVGDQIASVARAHDRALGRKDARARAVEELAKLSVNDPERRAHAFPHELSGGMCQRVLIAMAFSCRPRLVICDDATTGLDVTVQALVLAALKRRVDEEGAAALIVSHDVGIVAHTARTVVVLAQGTVVEQGPVEEVLVAPVHPATRLLVETARLGARGSEIAA
jgi:ABC-type glutathione transport system ATPase component